MESRKQAASCFLEEWYEKIARPHIAISHPSIHSIYVLKHTVRIMTDSLFNGRPGSRPHNFIIPIIHSTHVSLRSDPVTRLITATARAALLSAGEIRSKIVFDQILYVCTYVYFSSMIRAFLLLKTFECPSV